MYHPPPEFARAGLTRLKSRLYYPGSQKIFQGETQGMYFNFSDYAVDYDPDLQLFSILCGDPGTGVFVEHAAIRFRTLEDKPLQPEAFSSYRDETTLELESLTWRRTYSGGPLATPTLTIGFRLRSGFRLRLGFFFLLRPGFRLGFDIADLAGKIREKFVKFAAESII